MLRLTAAAGAAAVVPSLTGCTVAPSLPTFQGTVGPRPDQPERWSLLSDIHLCGMTSFSWGTVNMADHARAAVAGILQREQRPAGVIVNGDCSLEFGTSGDYEVFRQIVADPIAAAGIPIHLTLGNHDHRGRFANVLRRPLAGCGMIPPSALPADPRCDRLVSVVRSKYANFILLDSLDEHQEIAGSIGKLQLAWLDSALGELDDKPAIVFGHHPIEPERNWLWGNTSLLDGAELWKVLDGHRHVKSYIYGHTHRWEMSRRSHVHLINIPSSAFVFDPGQPSGWVDLWLGPDGAQFQLHRLKPCGPERPGECANVEWM
jgi:3',5'-cyclic AMP phosphodiesterase CpdA